MGKIDKFKALCATQILAILLLGTSYFGTRAERAAFEGVSEFLPVNAKCIESYRTGSSSYSLKRRIRNYNGYNNTYQYEVDGQIYTTILYYESSKGSDRILYYHPDDPQICSEFKTFWAASMHYALFTIGGLLSQGVVIFFVCRSLGKDKEKIVVQQSTGVVLNDDYDFYMKSENDQLDGQQNDSDSYQQMSDLTQRDSIPFVRKQEISQEDSISFMSNDGWVKTDLVSENKESTSESQSFDLYTEEEYKNRKSGDI